MSQYEIFRCSSMEEYYLKKHAYDLAHKEAQELRDQGVIVHLHIRYPLPPEGYDFPISIEAKGVYL